MSGSDPQQDGGGFDWSSPSIRARVEDQGVNSLLALLSPSKDLARSLGWDGVPVRRCCGWCALVNGCLQTNDRHLHAAPPQIPQGFGGNSDNC